jgi:hypothetical protein
MTKYNSGTYQSFTYGTQSGQYLRVDPLSATVVDDGVVRVTWSTPGGSYSGIRLVRNQSGYPETAYDGVVIYEEFGAFSSTTSVYPTKQTFLDGIENLTDGVGTNNQALTAGAHAYYRVFLQSIDAGTNGVWFVAGEVNTLIPSSLKSADTLYGLLPRVFTSSEADSVGPSSTDTTLYDYLYGFGLTHDELLTLTNLIKPDYSEKNCPPELLLAKEKSLGLPIEPNLPIKNRKELIKNAILHYANKGTLGGLTSFIYSLTGFLPEINLSKNLILNQQDSSFEKSVGNWTVTNGTLTSDSTIARPTVTNAITNNYVGKLVITTSPATMALGTSAVTKAVPVNEATQYTFSTYARYNSGATASIVLKIRWYDKFGNEIPSSVSSSASLSLTGSWAQKTLTATSPNGSLFAGFEVVITGSASQQITFDCFSFNEGTATTYYEPNAVDITLQPVRTNLVTNPSFENTGTTGWVTDGAIARVTSTYKYGIASLQLTANTSADKHARTSDHSAVTPNNYYTLSAYVKSDTVARNAYVSIKWWTSADVLISSTDGVQTATTTSNWTRLSVTGVAPSNASYATVYVYIKSPLSTEKFFIDALLFENTSTLLDYFDGSQAGLEGCVWSGTSGASVSYTYPSSTLKFDRLLKRLPDEFPLNIQWRVYVKGATIPVGQSS